MFKRSHKLIAGLNAGDFTDETFRLNELSNEFRVTGIVLQQQDLEGRPHYPFRMLPGGGSLTTAQKAPSSLTALTNS